MRNDGQSGGSENEDEAGVLSHETIGYERLPTSDDQLVFSEANHVDSSSEIINPSNNSSTSSALVRGLITSPDHDSYM